ncbi:helix-turn-helix domain-containing protein [Streptomyces sioyaensis]|uniref:helix-turn-helix domain-containing protein n=1 Tax=Streptomyces sioyaensis TaxID=67364 RepID=UPI0036B78260
MLAYAAAYAGRGQTWMTVCRAKLAEQDAELLGGAARSFGVDRVGQVTPALIASAHHISVRYLHCLFQQDKHTVSGFLREQRLERCRAELADPAHAARSVGAIRARWGFPDAAVFGRAFKRTYGVSPGEYRKRHCGHLAPAAGVPNTAK